MRPMFAPNPVTNAFGNAFSNAFGGAAIIPAREDLVAWYRKGMGITSASGRVSAWANQTGGEALVQATAANQPQFLTYSGTKYMNLTGRSGTYASTPDADALDITGDIDIRVRGTSSLWADSAEAVIAAKDNPSNISWRFRTSGTAALKFLWSANGTDALEALSTSANPASNGEIISLRVTMDVDNGAGGRDVKFWYSYDSNLSTATWTQLGATVTVAATTSIFAGTALMAIGARSDGVTQPWRGIIEAFQIYNGIAGTLVFDADFTAQAENATSFAESANGATVTLNGSAQLIGATSANTLLFNGVDSFLKTAPFTLNQPSSIYFLGRAVTWSANDRIFDGNASDSGGVLQVTSTPRIQLNAGSGAANNDNYTLGAYVPMVAVFNGANSLLKVGDTAAVTGNAGAGNMGGITLGAIGAGNANFANIQAKEMLSYSAAHDDNQINAAFAYLNMVNQL